MGRKANFGLRRGWVVGILIFLVVVVTFGKLFYFQEEQDPLEAELALQKQIGDIIAAKDLEGCNEVDNETYQTICISNIALNSAMETQDVSYCDMLDDELFSIGLCQLDILLEKAQSEKNVEYCEEIQDEFNRDFCKERVLAYLSIEENDSSYCDQMDGVHREACHSVFSVASEFEKGPLNLDCENMKTDFLKEDCLLYKEELEGGEFIYCDQFFTMDFKQYCRENSGEVSS